MGQAQQAAFQELAARKYSTCPRPAKGHVPRGRQSAGHQQCARDLAEDWRPQVQVHTPPPLPLREE